MKKSFLLGLAAMLLPLATWAQSNSSPLHVTVDETFIYNGDQTEAVKEAVTVTFGDENSELQESDYEMSISPETVKNVGKYTVTITGKGSYAYYPSVSATFTVTPKVIETVTLKPFNKSYGTEDSAVDLTSYVELSESDLVAGDKPEDIIQCLHLTRLNPNDQTETVGSVIKVYVNSSEEDNGNYKYTFKNGDIVEMTIVPALLTVAFPEDGLTHIYNGQAKNLTELEQTYKGKVGTEDVSVTLSVKGNNELKNVGEYTLVATLAGANAANYTLDNSDAKTRVETKELTDTYTIKRATLKIEALDENSLTKVYSGMETKGTDFTTLYSITTKPQTNETAEDLGLTMIMGEGGGLENLPNVGSYLVNPTVNGTPIWKNTDGKGYSEPTLLPNYSIEYDRDNLKYTITERPVYFYFEGKSKAYTGEEITLGDDDYELKVVESDDESGFVDEDGFEADPTAKVEETIKNAKDYALVLDEEESPIGRKQEDGSIINGNYKFIQTQEDGQNVFTVTPGTVTIVVNPQSIAFGEEVTAETLKKWGQYEYEEETTKIPGTTITNDPYSATTDRQELRKMIELYIKEGANISESRTYEDVICVRLKSSLSETQQTIVNNYGGFSSFKITEGDLTVNGVSTTITLDAIAEDTNATLEEGEEESAVPTVAELLDQYNGATVEKVVVKNLKNNLVGNDDYEETDQIIKKGRWYTLVLPFDVTVAELSRKFGYAIVNIPDENYEGNEKDIKGNLIDVKFKLEMGEIKANTLMLFKVAEDTDWSSKEMENGIKFKNKKIVNPGEDYTWASDNAGHTFIGLYSKTTLEDANDYFYNSYRGWLTASSTVVEAKKHGVDVYPLNGYFKFDTPAGANVRIFVEEADGTVTAISDVPGDVENTNAEGWYTIGGVKLNAQPTQKGIYINNGKKVVIK